MDVVMPQLGETVSEGKVSTWFKAPGDQVAAGENLFEIETDKVTMDVQAIASGVLSEIRVQSGETAPVGTVVAVIGEAGAAPPPPLRGRAGEGGGPQTSTRDGSFRLAPFAETNTPTENYGKANGPLGIKITPLARRLIAQNGIDVAALAQAARAKGAPRIARADVLAAIGGGAGGAAPQDTRAPSVAPSPLPGLPQGGGRALCRSAFPSTISAGRPPSG